MFFGALAIPKTKEILFHVRHEKTGIFWAKQRLKKFVCSPKDRNFAIFLAQQRLKKLFYVRHEKTFPNLYISLGLPVRSNPQRFYLMSGGDFFLSGNLMFEISRII